MPWCSHWGLVLPGEDAPWRTKSEGGEGRKGRGFPKEGGFAFEATKAATAQTYFEHWLRVVITSTKEERISLASSVLQTRNTEGQMEAAHISGASLATVTMV